MFCALATLTSTCRSILEKKEKINIIKFELDQTTIYFLYSLIILRTLLISAKNNSECLSRLNDNFFFNDIQLKVKYII